MKSLIPALALSLSVALAQEVPTQEEVLRRIALAPSEAASPPPFVDGKFSLMKNEVIAFVGQENFVREQKSGHLEARLASAFVELTPRFRSLAWEADTVYAQWRDFNFGNWAQQIEATGATTIIAQFGQMEALDGTARLTEFTTAYHRLLDQFAAGTRRLVLISPMPFEKPLAPQAPDLTKRNADVAAYASAIRDIARSRDAVFIDLSAYQSDKRLTDDGIHLTDSGLRELAGHITRSLNVTSKEPGDELLNAIIQKNALWFDCWRPANWSFVYGDRVNQMYGKSGGSEPPLKGAFERQLPLVGLADARIHALARGDNAAPLILPKPKITEEPMALSPDEQMATFTLADGYQVNLFASEELGVINPTQISWDEKGRLYVACSPSYPQSLASSEPADFILICEDTDADGRADKSWRFADGLTMVQGVEPGAGGVYVCDFDQLLHLRDTNGDGKADERRVVFSGFGVGDTHQLVNSICHGPDGSLWFTQGLHAMSRVETPWGIARLDRAAVWRLRPNALRLEGYFGGGMAGANCWGVAFDDYGQVFHKSGDRPQGYWSVPGLVRGADPRGSSSETEASASYGNSPEQYHSVGPLFDTSPKTTALDIIGTRALPDEIQGCALIGGYFGSVVELHRFADAGAGFKTTQLPKLMTSSNNAFRPVDVSVGPDGAMYLADWYNPIIGHYQASYADPMRDKSHGRIWRIRSKNHQPVIQPKLAEMPAAELLKQLGSSERWTRYQAKRLLFDMPKESVIAAADAWAKSVTDEKTRLELTGVYEAHNTPRPELLKKMLASSDHRIRAYAARVAGIWADDLLPNAVRDPHPRVRLESIVAATYIPRPDAIQIVTSALDQPRDAFLDYAIRASARALQPLWAKPFTKNQLTFKSDVQQTYLKNLLGELPRSASPGEEVYTMACMTCHQPGGKGLPGIYPPIIESNPDKMIKIVLHGLTGPITVNGQIYGDKPNSVPMPPMGGLSDQQIADVLTFLRKGAPAVTAEKVKSVRNETNTRAKPWTAAELAE